MKIYCEVDGKRYEIVPWIACDKDHCSVYDEKLCNWELAEEACAEGDFLNLYNKLSSLIDNGYALKEVASEES